MAELEMVKCPVCGKPFPKKRVELGYNTCVNCSTVKRVVGLGEDLGEGDHTYSVLHIVQPEVARAVYRAQNMGKVTVDVDAEDEGDAPDFRTFEEQEEDLHTLNPTEREAKYQEMENEFQGMTERSIDELGIVNSVLGTEEDEE